MFFHVGNFESTINRNEQNKKTKEKQEERKQFHTFVVVVVNIFFPLMFYAFEYDDFAYETITSY